jgi:cyclophilin family peptidyl-prolyl cis-trans isomerase
MPSRRIVQTARGIGFGIVCIVQSTFAFDPQVGDSTMNLGRLVVLKARLSQELRAASMDKIWEGGKQVETFNQDKFELALFVAGVVQPAFAPDQAAQLAALSSGPVDRVIKEIMDLSGLTADGKVKAYGLFCPSTAGMARTGDPDSASTQFFLMRQAFPSLDSQYTPWGRVVAGLEVVRAITVGEPPANPDTMTKVQMAADMPAADRPKVWRVDTASAAFRDASARMANCSCSSSRLMK